MEPAHRHRLILEELHATGRVQVVDLAEQLGTSGITIRRDLEVLAEAGALRRVHGGATTTALRGEGVPFQVRLTPHDPLKARLASAVAALVTDGEAVSVDSGTTGAAVAKALANRRITAVPLSVQSLTALSGAAAIVVPGGEVDPVEGTFSGPLLEQSLASLRLDTAVLSCCGADPWAGVMAYSLRDAAAKRAARRVAARTILIAEASKFAKSAMALVCPLTKISTLVTDDTLPTPVRRFCDDHDIEVVTVPFTS